MSRLTRMGTGLLRPRTADKLSGHASLFESRSSGLDVLQKRGLGSFRSKSGLHKGRDFGTVNRSPGQVSRLLAIGLTVSAASLLGLLVSRFIQICCSCGRVKSDGARAGWHISVIQ